MHAWLHVGAPRACFHEIYDIHDMDMRMPCACVRAAGHGTGTARERVTLAQDAAVHDVWTRASCMWRDARCAGDGTPRDTSILCGSRMGNMNIITNIMPDRGMVCLRFGLQTCGTRETSASAIDTAIH